MDYQKMPRGPWGQLSIEERAGWVKRLYDEMEGKDKATMRKMCERIGVKSFGVLALVSFLISLKLDPKFRSLMEEGSMEEELEKWRIARKISNLEEEMKRWK